MSNETNKKIKCPICDIDQEDLYLYHSHLRLFHSHEDLARFLAYGKKYNEKILVDDDLYKTI